ncbi:MAG: hypothetical protein ABF752_12675 [Acetobacter fabarum]|uniref:hypothetical protein n=1 Tax=Acetobacter fabarum TaxID=483199 RepID=UPI0039ED87C1
MPMAGWCVRQCVAGVALALPYGLHRWLGKLALLPLCGHVAEVLASQWRGFSGPGFAFDTGWSAE